MTTPEEAPERRAATDDRLRRIVIHRPGAYDHLKLETAAIPSPGPDEVLIEVHAAGVNFADGMVRMGLYESAKEFVGWPITPGFEVAGVIKAVGKKVGDHRVDDEVLAVTLFGGYTSHLVVPAHQVFKRPPGLSAVEAAALPSVFLTAWFALFELAHPRPGYRALVHSAAGGVGSMLVQLLKIAGAEVVGVVGGSHKVEPARALGADHVIDRSREDLWAAAERIAPEGYDLILDANGVATLKQSYRHLGKAGKLVIYGFHSMMSPTGRPNWLKLASGYLRTPRFNPFEMTSESKSVLAFNLSYLFDRTDLLALGMDDLFRWLSEGKLAPPAITTYPLQDAAEAQRAIESARTVGKLVLTP